MSGRAPGWFGLFLIILLPCSAFCQSGPANLNAELLLDGEVQLSWDPAPPQILDSYDGPLVNYDLLPSNTWYVEDGYLKGLVSAGWKSACYGGEVVENFTVATTIRNVSGASSRGLLIRGDGPRDNDYNGYCFYISLSSQSFAFYSYEDGYYDLLLGWTPSDLINLEPGEENSLAVTANGSNFLLYVNNNYVGTVSDNDYNQGYIGLVSSGSNEVWYDELVCYYDPPMNNDDLIEYRVFRDGLQVGTTLDSTYTDTLPAPGEYTYSVNAVFEPGGITPLSNEASVDWELVTLSLLPENTTIPATGGSLHFSAHLVNTVNQSWPTVRFWTSVTPAGGQPVGPLTSRYINIQPYMDLTVTNMHQPVPSTIPAGDYLLSANLGYYPVSLVSDTFEFTKLEDDSVAYGGSNIIVNGAGSDLLSVSDVGLSSWPNPSNGLSTVKLSLPETAQVTVEVVNVPGRRVALLAGGTLSAGTHQFVFDGSNLATGVYFVRMVSDQYALQIQKIMLLK